MEGNNAVAAISLKRKVGYEIAPVSRAKVRRIDKEDQGSKKEDGESKKMDEGGD
jgi:hypothetical protein